MEPSVARTCAPLTGIPADCSTWVSASTNIRSTGSVPEIEGISAGGMPDRVKCLHVLAGQSLAQGRGVNPLGDEVLDLLGEWWDQGPCV